MKTLFLCLVMCLMVRVANSQALDGSSIYFENGQLKADSSFSISKQQFEIWKRYENAIVDQVFSAIKYPISMQENGISFYLIVSFYIGVNGEIVNLNIEKSQEQHKAYFIKQFGASAIASIYGIYMSYPVLAGLGKYYLPINYMVRHIGDNNFTDQKSIIDGVLVFYKGAPRLITVEYPSKSERWW